MTLPAEFRRRHRIKEGSLLRVDDEGQRLVIEPVPDFGELIGSDVGRYSLEEAGRMLDKSRKRWR